jgi:hypothetical protein
MWLGRSPSLVEIWSPETLDIREHHSMDPDEVQLPRLGDRLFDGAKDERRTVACVNFAWDEWEGYATGYHLAGRYLVDRIAETDRDQDFLVYPIIFCYRHAAEVRMKRIVLSARRLGLELELPDDHDLVRLWQRVESLIRELWPGRPGTDDHLVAIGEQLTELASMDRGSFTFRYPVSKPNRAGQRQPTIPQDVRNIGLATFAERMDAILDYLDGIHTGCSEEADAVEDGRAYDEQLRAEARAEMETERRAYEDTDWEY